MSRREGERLAKLIRQAGKRGERVEEITRIALRELPRTLEQPDIGIPKYQRDEVESLVIEAVWRWWIPTAKRYLAEGLWKPGELLSKLRTALCWYARSKVQQVAAKEKRRSAHEVSVDGDLIPEEVAEAPEITPQNFFFSTEEEIFVRRLYLHSSGTVPMLGEQRALRALKILIVVRRAIGSNPKPLRNGWTWNKLFSEIAFTLGDGGEE